MGWSRSSMSGSSETKRHSAPLICWEPAAAGNLPILRKRLLTICKRTLRRQVQQAGLIRLHRAAAADARIRAVAGRDGALSAVSAYLQRRDTIAFGENQNALVTLVVRKILGSSTFAVSETLARIIERLKKHQRADIETVADYDAVGERCRGACGDAEAEVADAPPIDPEKLKAEIALLEAIPRAGAAIGDERKGLKLIAALPKALDEIVEKGRNAKRSSSPNRFAPSAISRSCSRPTAMTVRSFCSMGRTPIR